MAKKNGNGNTAVEEAPSKKARTVMRFRLKKDVGSHFEPNPDYDPDSPVTDDNLREIEYQAGDIVKSTRNLAKVFENKFTAFDKMGKAIGDEEEIDPDEANEDARQANLRAAKRAEEEAEEDPTQAEVTKQSQTFRNATEQARKRAKLEAELSGEDEDDEEEETPRARKAREKLEAEGLGDDVTEDFEGAADADFKVHKRGTSYFVTDADDKVLSSKKGIKWIKVGSFIKKQQASTKTKKSRD